MSKIVRKLILAAGLILALAGGCVAPGGQVEAIPEPTGTAPVAPAATDTPGATSSPGPTPTAVPPALILADYPLAAGAIWKYAAEISYQDPQVQGQLARWTGFVTERVSAQRTTADGRLIFSMERAMEPHPPEQVWKQPASYEYTLRADGVFNERMKIYRWPLADNTSWKASEPTDYNWQSNYVGDVWEPYGALKGCYVFTLVTNPDVTNETFCPGIGFVEHAYQHLGTPQMEHWTLIFYKPGE